MKDGTKVRLCELKLYEWMTYDPIDGDMCVEPHAWTDLLDF